MLTWLRTTRRGLAGTATVLVAGSWLALAAAPCFAAGHDAHGTHAGHCEHCDTADAACAMAASGALPVATPAASLDVKPSDLAPPPVFAPLPRVEKTSVPATRPVLPTDRPPRQRFCRLIE